MTAVTAGAAVLVVIMALLLVTALRAREEAEGQRSAAEGLVEYMLTDLREKLNGVGRPEVMATVNAWVLNDYAAHGDLSRLPDDSLERPARVLHALGDDNQRMGKLDRALASFAEANLLGEPRRAADVLRDRIGRTRAVFGEKRPDEQIIETEFRLQLFLAKALSATGLSAAAALARGEGLQAMLAVSSPEAGVRADKIRVAISGQAQGGGK